MRRGRRGRRLSGMTEFAFKTGLALQHRVVIHDSALVYIVGLQTCLYAAWLSCGCSTLA